MLRLLLYRNLIRIVGHLLGAIRLLNRLCVGRLRGRNRLLNGSRLLLIAVEIGVTVLVVLIVHSIDPFTKKLVSNSLLKIIITKKTSFVKLFLKKKL